MAEKEKPNVRPSQSGRINEGSTKNNSKPISEGPKTTPPPKTPPPSKGKS